MEYAEIDTKRRNKKVSKFRMITFLLFESKVIN